MNVLLIVAGVVIAITGAIVMGSAKLRALRELGSGVGNMVGGLGAALGDGLSAFSSEDDDVVTAAGRGLTAMAAGGAKVQEEAVRRFGPMERQYVLGRYTAIAGALLLVLGIVLSFV